MIFPSWIERDGSLMVLVDRYFNPNFWALGALPLALALDQLLGNRRHWFDPGRGIGWLTVVAERALRSLVGRARGGPRSERWAGVVLSVIVVGLVASLAWLVAILLDLIGGPTTLIGQALMIMGCLSIRGLGRQILRVSAASSLFEARRELSRIDGRDASRLDPTAINRVCVELIGARTNEWIIALLFWLAVLGPAGLWGYQAIKTLDRIVGSRKGPTEENFGRASSRIAELADFIPARLTWLLIALSAALLNEDGRSSLRLGWRVGRIRLTPSTAWGQAAMVGALGVHLGGTIDRTFVPRAIRIMQVTALHGAALSLTARILCFGT